MLLSHPDARVPAQQCFRYTTQPNPLPLQRQKNVPRVCWPPQSSFVVSPLAPSGALGSRDRAVQSAMAYRRVRLGLPSVLSKTVFAIFAPTRRGVRQRLPVSCPLPFSAVRRLLKPPRRPCHLPPRLLALRLVPPTPPPRSRLCVLVPRAWNSTGCTVRPHSLWVQQQPAFQCCPRKRIECRSRRHVVLVAVQVRAGMQMRRRSSSRSNVGLVVGFGCGGSLTPKLPAMGCTASSDADFSDVTTERTSSCGRTTVARRSAPTATAAGSPLLAPVTMVQTNADDALVSLIRVETDATNPLDAGATVPTAMDSYATVSEYARGQCMRPRAARLSRRPDNLVEAPDM